MDNLKVYIDRLKGGTTQKIAETLPPDFLDIKEEELIFKDPVRVRGEVYLADDYLVIQLNVETTAQLPCAICNEIISFPVVIKNANITLPLSEINSAIIDLSEKIRETILLQIPLFTECNNGKCPERENIKKFLKTEEKPSDPEDVTHFPFSNL